MRFSAAVRIACISPSVNGSVGFITTLGFNQDRWAVERQADLGADEATALINTDAQRTGLQPPKYAFTPKKVVTRVDPAPSRSTYR
jgi:hypothetical protein